MFEHTYGFAALDQVNKIAKECQNSKTNAHQVVKAIVNSAIFLGSYGLVPKNWRVCTSNTGCSIIAGRATIEHDVLLESLEPDRL